MSADEWVGIRVWMQDRRKFQADASAVAASIDHIDKRSAHLGKTQDETSKKTWLMNQALFTIRRVVYGFTLAIGAAATAVGFLGFRFNMLMETARVSFTVLLGSSRLARQEIETLFQLAATTPFDFQNIQMAARQLLNYGFSLNETNRYLKTFADVVAGFGGDVTVIERITRALGQMRTKGRVFAEELRQLQEAGVPATRYLMEQLGLTQDQIAQIGRLRLRADYGIEAIIRGLETDPKFKGASAALQKTVQGRLTTISDYSQRLFGRILLRPFQLFRRELRTVEYRLKILDKVMKNKGFTAMVARLDQMVGASGKLVAVWWLLMTAGTALGLVLTQTIIPALKLSSDILAPILIPLFYLLGHAMLFAAQNSSILKYALAALIVYLTLTRLWMIRVWTTAKLLFFGGLLLRMLRNIKALTLGTRTALQIFGFWGVIAGLAPGLARLIGVFYRMYLVMKLVFLTNLAGRGLIYALFILGRQLLLLPLLFFSSTRAGAALIAMFVRLGGVIRASVIAALIRLAVVTRSAALTNFLLVWGYRGLAVAIRAAAVSMIMFLATNPVGWAILAIAALAILYLKWKAFHDLVDRTVAWIRSNWGWLRFALLATFLGPIIATIEGAKLLVGWFGRIKDFVVWMYNMAKKPIEFAIKFKMPGQGFLDKIKGPSGLDIARGGWSLAKGIVGQAQGGITRGAGWSLVGEQGPELMWMGQGATVVPLPDLGRALRASVLPVDATSPSMSMPEYEVSIFSTPVYLQVDKRTIAEANADFRLEVRARR
jgi:tape measure domain-containing protein